MMLLADARTSIAEHNDFESKEQDWKSGFGLGRRKADSARKSALARAEEHFGGVGRSTGIGHRKEAQPRQTRDAVARTGPGTWALGKSKEPATDCSFGTLISKGTRRNLVNATKPKSRLRDRRK